MCRGLYRYCGIEADFDVVFGPAVACEDFVYPVAEVPFYFEDEAADPLFCVARAVGQNLLRERIHAAARFSRPDRTEDCDTSEQAPLGDDEPLRALCGDLFPGIVDLSEDKEKIVSLLGGGEEGQFASSDSLLRLERKNVQPGEHNGVANVRGGEQK